MTSDNEAQGPAIVWGVDLPLVRQVDQQLAVARNPMFQLLYRTYVAHVIVHVIDGQHAASLYFFATMHDGELRYGDNFITSRHPADGDLHTFTTMCARIFKQAIDAQWEREEPENQASLERWNDRMRAARARYDENMAGQNSIVALEGVGDFTSPLPGYFMRSFGLEPESSEADEDEGDLDPPTE